MSAAFEDAGLDLEASDASDDQAHKFADTIYEAICKDCEEKPSRKGTFSLNISFNSTFCLRATHETRLLLFINLQESSCLGSVALKRAQYRK
jgi:hypothetical protein